MADATESVCLSPAALKDLAASGLNENAIRQLHLSPAKGDSYRIPYYDFNGRQTSFYRVKLIPSRQQQNGRTQKYAQPSHTSPEAYYPRIITPDFWKSPDEEIIFTEGEKKAAKACLEGFLTIGLGGVDAWRTRLDGEGRKTNISVPVETLTSLPLHGRSVTIIFDSEPDENPHVQRAAFDFGIWLTDQGARVRQVYLPCDEDEKVGLDDYLVHNSPEDLRQLLDESPWIFPRHPDLGRLVKGLPSRPARQDQIRVVRGVIAELDMIGQRYKDGPHTFYFHWTTRTLHKVEWDPKNFFGSPFAGLLKSLGGEISATDAILVSRIRDWFVTQEPIVNVKPHNIMWAETKPDRLYYQLNDSRMVKVTADEIIAQENGEDEVLFEAGKVEPIDEEALGEALQQGPQDMWIKTLQDTQLRPITGMNIEQTRLYLACCFHLSPWLRRWRGLMLPMELAIAEPGSGKSALYNLRRGILTGRPSLDNSPKDMRDWYASASNAPGLWVCDNMSNLKRDLHDELSDEIARLITDPTPSAKMRELYTTATEANIQIDTVFAITAVRNPFWKPDLMQRCIVFNMKAVPEGDRDSYWYQDRLEKRVEWVAEHLGAIQGFFQYVRRDWNQNYHSTHRLGNFEQALKFMGYALGHKRLTDEMISSLPYTVQSAVVSADHVLEALREFAREWVSQNGTQAARPSDITDWVDCDPDQRYGNIRILQNTVAIGQYISQHEHDVRVGAGLAYEYDSSRHVHRLRPIPDIIRRFNLQAVS